MVSDIRRRTKEKHPLIHCITNPISINGCANVILAAGARPMMAEHPDEVSEVTRTAGAVMLNLGNLTDVRKISMLISAETAKKLGIPFILDTCGAACLANRRELAMRIINDMTPSVIKGNYSEIKALCDEGYSSSGVDADAALGTQDIARCASELAVRYDAVVLASGVTDIVTDGKRMTYIRNGTPQLGTITGTGCMLGALCAAYLTGALPYDAASAACAVFGICGELAQTDKGSGTFYVQLLDALSTVNDSIIAEKIRTEERGKVY
ncbi:MAG: hydroxyethylthiazole kinase [Oscillospiraceae bacterium]|nr:hydroxyethylthiazole kinase [Oscillospiraceae bacterium]